MRILLDSCVWGNAKRELAEAGHDATWAGNWDRDPGDEEILRIAHAEKRVLITLDKDFGEIAIVRGFPHHGIVRLVSVSAREQARMTDLVLDRFGDQLLRGAIVTIDPYRARIRPGEETSSE